MKRQDVKSGVCYRDTHDRQVRVLDTEPGWRLKDGQWLRDETQRQRRMVRRGVSQWETYRHNHQLKAELVGVDGEVCPHVTSPRQLVEPWADYAARMATENARTAEAQAQALKLADLVQAHGLIVQAVDMETGTINVFLPGLLKVLGHEDAVASI